MPPFCSMRIHLRVNNALDAIRFYQLSFDAVVYFDHDNDGSVHLQFFGAHVILNKPGFEPAGTMLCFTCPNVEAVVARAERAGHCEVTVRGDRFCDCCITIMAEVKDPFDNVWCFRQTVPDSVPVPPCNYQPHALFAGVIGLVHIFVQKLRPPPSKYAVVVLMLLWNKYTWAFWDALVVPKLDLGARLVGFWLIWDKMSSTGNVLLENP